MPKELMLFAFDMNCPNRWGGPAHDGVAVALEVR